MAHYQCPQCGFSFDTPQNLVDPKCPACGNRIQPMYSGFQQQQGPQPQPQPQYGYGYQPVGVFDEGPSGKSRGVAGLFAILLGCLGIHYFYLGKVGGGIFCILLCCITCGVWSIVCLVQGILMMSMKSEEFEQKYVNNSSTFPLF